MNFSCHVIITRNKQGDCFASSYSGIKFWQIIASFPTRQVNMFDLQAYHIPFNVHLFVPTKPLILKKNTQILSFPHTRIRRRITDKGKKKRMRKVLFQMVYITLGGFTSKKKNWQNTKNAKKLILTYQIKLRKTSHLS